MIYKSFEDRPRVAVLDHEDSQTCDEQKHFGSQTGQCPPPRATKKAENIDQLHSSIPFAADSEDTTALAEDGLHLTPFPLQLQAAIFSSRYL